MLRNIDRLKLNMFNKIKSLFQDKSENSRDIDYTDPSQSIPFTNLGYNWLVNCAKTGSYDNTFPNISRIAEAFAEVLPYAIDDKGEKLTTQPKFIETLYNPNEEMSATDFFETLIVMLMVHPIVYLLCWHREGGEIKPGGPITKDNIAGFTFLEGFQINVVGGFTTYTNGIETWTKDDVMALSLNVNPYSLVSGYSPSLAVKKWATIDDYIAEYQTGVFRNGAVPAGMFIITAATVDDFNESVDNMQKHHRGASNANNVIYVHRPTSAIDGKPMQAQVEWVPFAQTNKDMTLESIFNQANKKIDMNFGVPEEVKGHVSNSTYASAEVADYIFSRRVVYPKLVKVYSKLTHEGNRITRKTGGLGFSISFDYDVPVLTDTRKVQVETLQMLLNSGFTLESTVAALKLPKSYLALERSSMDSADNLQALESDANIPSQTDNSKQQSSKLAPLSHSCRKDLDFDMPTNQILNSPMFTSLRSQLLIAIKKLVDHAKETINDRKEDIKTEADVAAIINTLQQWLKDNYNERTTNLVLPILFYIMLNAGEEAAQDFAKELGIDLDEFDLSQEEMEKYSQQIATLIGQYNEQTVEHIKAILNQVVAGIIAQDGIDAALDDLKQRDEYRADRWAMSEQHRAEQTAILIAATLAANESDLEAYKTWRINPNSPDLCADCLVMDGQTVRANEAFSNGDMIPHYHPFCYCTVEWTFRPKTRKSIKVFCPNCKRYMFESTGREVKNYICPNGKCKKHYDVNVSKGKVITKEVGGKHDNR